MVKATKCVFFCLGLSLDLPGRGFGNRHRQELHVMDRPPSVKCDLEYSPVSLPTHRISSVALTREMADGRTGPPTAPSVIFACRWVPLARGLGFRNG